MEKKGVMYMLHSYRIVPGTYSEQYFKELLLEAGVKMNLVMCKIGKVFGRPYDEYILSDGLNRILCDDLEEFKEA